jgi:hypothetical protein
MSRQERIVTGAGILSGVAAAICYIALILMMAGSNIETLQRLVP